MGAIPIQYKPSVLCAQAVWLDAGLKILDVGSKLPANHW